MFFYSNAAYTFVMYQ